MSAAIRKILIRSSAVELSAQLLDTPTAARVWATLPIRAVAQTFGQEIHFDTHVETGWEPGAREIINLGEIGFSVENDNITIGFGPTPISRGDEIRLDGPANIFAVFEDLDELPRLSGVKPGQLIEVLAVKK